MLAAQQAPIGAKICTTSANRTIGRNLFSRARITSPSEREPNHLESPKSRSGSRVFIPLWPDYPTRPGVGDLTEIDLPKYRLLWGIGRYPQPIVVKSQSFRRLLEF